MSEMYVNLDTLALNQHLLSVTTQREQRGDKEVERITVALLRDGVAVYAASATNPKSASPMVKTLAARIAADQDVAWDGEITRRWDGQKWSDMTPEIKAWGAALSSVLGVRYSDMVTKEGFLQTCYTAGVAAAAGKEKRVFSAVGKCHGVPVRDGVLVYSAAVGWTVVQHSPENCNTAVLDVDSGAVLEHIKEPTEGLLSHYLNSSFAPDHRRFVPQWLGLHLIKHTLRASAGQRFLLLQGAGGEGKSVLVEMISGLVGAGNCAFVGLDELNERTYHMLEGKIAMIAPENDPHKPWDIRGVNRITSGERLKARPVYQLPRVFEPVCLVTQICNEPPRFNEQSRALERRMLVVHMTAFQDEKGKRIPDLGRKIVEQEYAQLVGYALWGAQVIHENGGELAVPASVAAAGVAMARSDVQVESLLPMLEFGRFAISLKELRAAYVNMCLEEGKQAMAMPKLIKEIVRVAEREKVRCGDGVHTPFLPTRLDRRTGYDTALAVDNKFKRRFNGNAVSIVRDPKTGENLRLEVRESLLYGVRIRAGVLDDHPVGLSWESVDARSNDRAAAGAGQADALPHELAQAKVAEIADRMGISKEELARLVATAANG